MVAVSVPDRLRLVTRPGSAGLVADISLALHDQGLAWQQDGVPVTVRDFDWTFPSAAHGGDNR
jgi:hypothetical protein